MILTGHRKPRQHVQSSSHDLLFALRTLDFIVPSLHVSITGASVHFSLLLATHSMETEEHAPLTTNLNTSLGWSTIVMETWGRFSLLIKNNLLRTPPAVSRMLLLPHSGCWCHPSTSRASPWQNSSFEVRVCIGLQHRGVEAISSAQLSVVRGIWGCLGGFPRFGVGLPVEGPHFKLYGLSVGTG